MGLMKIDNLTRQAIQHTVHCLIGCGIGEVVGMIISSSLGWDKIGRVSLSVLLAFLFGYLLTYRGVRKHASSANEAIRITLATDTISIATMELVANVVELLIPGALMVTIISPLFWTSLLISMSIAFIFTVPVNRYMISRKSHSHHSMHH